ncbi:MAG: glycogen synthase [Fibrobacteraceae bacterium]|nr:glycogen synthase [Fibrobacteraceae bacterium]
MKVALLTNEFPPDIYGGAGIHVQFLSRELTKLCKIEARAFGTQNDQEKNLNALGFAPKLGCNPADTRMAKILNPLDINVQWMSSLKDMDIIHCHTWYSHFGGILGSRLFECPLVLTTHSLEPHRPWKAEQLGNGGYKMSSWIERTAYEAADGVIAVSGEMKRDVMNLYNVPADRIQVIYNGIDPDFYKPTFEPAILEKYGIDKNKPFILFVGRITRQKGISQLIGAIPHIKEGVQVVLCAGAPDTPELAKECETKINELKKTREGIFWIQEMMQHKELRVLYSYATAFVTPSLYEPFGIINLEAMSCGTPVVGSAVGGIPEIIVEGKTGFLVPLEARSSIDFEPKDPDAFQHALADKLNKLLENPDLAKSLGEASRKRAIDVFSWKSIAKQTFNFYGSVIARYKAEGARK